MISGYLSCKFAAQPGKIESSIDLAHQMIFGDCVIELKLVEKLPLFALQPSHHGLPLPRFASARWNHGSRQASADFCNKVCQDRHPEIACAKRHAFMRTELAQTEGITFRRLREQFYTYGGYEPP